MTPTVRFTYANEAVRQEVIALSARKAAGEQVASSSTKVGRGYLITMAGGSVQKGHALYLAHAIYIPSKRRAHWLTATEAQIMTCDPRFKTLAR